MSNKISNLEDQRIAAAAGHAGPNRRRNKMVAWELELAFKEAVLQAASEGVTDQELIRSRILAARHRVKQKYAEQ